MRTVAPKRPVTRKTPGRQVKDTPRPTLEYKDFRNLAVKVIDQTQGIVEALVAVSGNTDDGGDIISPGAFFYKRHPKVVWSHDLDDLIGKVLEHEEYKPGDPRLPADLQAKKLGALRFLIQFDLEDPDSFRRFRKVVFHEDLGWSIGYETDPKGFKVLADGRRLLTKIYVWEASPVTFGMNSEARTMDVKSLNLGRLGLGEEKTVALESLLGTLLGPTEEKSYPALDGSWEQVQDELRESIMAWGTQSYGPRSDDCDWWPRIEGTFDDNVVVTFHDWNATFEDVTYQFPYVFDGDGCSLGTPVEVEVQATVAPAAKEPDAPAPSDAMTAMMALAQSMAATAKDGGPVLDMKALVEEVKKGRVLSAANAAKLKTAMETIQNVLASAGSGDDPKPKAEVKPKAKDAPKADAKKTTSRTLATKAPTVEEVGRTNAWLLEALANA